MSSIVGVLKPSVKQRLRHLVATTGEARLRTRCAIILDLADGYGVTAAAQRQRIARTTVYSVLQRFAAEGEAGLIDHRLDNGQQKLTEEYLAVLYEVVYGAPEDYGWLRATWTRELLVATMHRQTGISIHVSTMSKALAMIGARRGRPKPTVGCPWSAEAKQERFEQIARDTANLPANEVVLYEDEVDIPLNPKIGLDWMLRGQQKQVPTPGTNEKRYLAGAQDRDSGVIHATAGPSKSSRLFVALLNVLELQYPQARRIHLILDNYRIHTSKITQQALASFEGLFVLHFLPPYCPDDNRIERAWQDLHANVTRNHRCQSMDELMRNAWNYVQRHNRTKRQQRCYTAPYRAHMNPAR